MQSRHITINKSYLDTLGAGTHKLTVTFTDGGSITIDYEVKAPAQTVAAPATTAAAVPASGEGFAITTAIGATMVIISCGVVVTMLIHKRKEDA